MSASDRVARPDFMIIGAMKSATTTLHAQLAAQPGFHMSTPKEPHYFSEPSSHARGPDWYASLFEGAAPEDLRGESSTSYTKLPTYPEVVDRVAAACPDARFIYVMRHPVDRLVSHYVHAWTEHDVDAPIDVEATRYAPLVQYGLYAMQLAPWLDRFGRDRVLPVFFDRLRAHPQAELDRVCRFLGYERKPTWASLEAQNVSAERERKSRLRTMLTEGPVLTALRRTFVPKAVRTWIRSFWQMRGRPTLSAETRARLERTFDDDLGKLGSWLGTDLSCRSFAEATRDRAHDWV